MTTLPCTVTAPSSCADVQLCARTLPPIKEGNCRPSIKRRAPALSCTLPPMFACEIVQLTPDPTKTLPVILPENEPVHIASAARAIDAPPRLAAKTTTTMQIFAAIADDNF